MSHTRLALLLLPLLVGRAAATTSSDLCAPAAPSCVIEVDAVVTPGSTLDFGNRPLTLKAGRKLDVGAGTMTILARSLTLEPSSGLFARGQTDGTGALGGTIIIRTTGGVRILASTSGRARVDASADVLPGSIVVTAGDDIEVNGILAAQGTSAGGGSGNIDLTTTGSFTVGEKGEINAFGAVLGDGGDVTIIAGGGVVANGPVDCHGAEEGGTITIQSGDGVSTSPDGELDVSASDAFGSGGSISLFAGGNLLIEGRILGDATGSSADGNSAGGEVNLSATGDVTVNASINVSGASPDGEGGSIEVVAGRDATLAAAFDVRGRGGQGSGGSVTVSARRDATLGPIDAGGGILGGGLVFATADRTLTVPAPIDADGDGGFGGLVTLTAETLAVSGEVRAGGPAGGSTGGRTELSACTLTLAGTGMLITRPGPGGENTLKASGQMSLLAGSALLSSGLNRLEYRPGRPPVTAGTIDPAAQLVENASLRRCVGEIPPNCGNHLPDPGEDCDDGNNLSCDGCSDVCVLEAGLICGDGVLNVGCGEVCDDGNTLSCDGCRADCKRADNSCGDSITECGEQCDDGNTTSCDGANGQPGCSALCRRDGICGDAVVECGEECDEGAGNNGKPGGVCDAVCHLRPLPSCGDGTVNPGEECDDHNDRSCDGCSSTCHVEICRNNVIDCGEECDDANGSACDGCSSCRQERCGNQVVDCGEQCDDGNVVNGDACDSNCTTPRCGNGVRAGTEQCDDGNDSFGDGCDAACRIEVPCPGGAPGFCTPCVTEADCDPRGGCAGKRCVERFCVDATPLDCNDNRGDTLDRCVLGENGSARCEHDCLTPTACDDGNRCNGTETCKATHCTPGAALDCNDGDACTEDSCAPATGCQHGGRSGFEGINCRLKAIDDAILNAGPTDITTAVKRKIGKARLAAGAKASGALAAQQVGNAKRERKLLNAAQKRIASLERLIGASQLRNRISGPLADALVQHTTGASRVVAELLAGLATSSR